MRKKSFIAKIAFNGHSQCANKSCALIVYNITYTNGSKFMTIDNSNFYINSPLPLPEFIKIKLSDIPKEIIDKYKL